MADQSTATLGLGNAYSAANLLAHGLKRASRVNMMQLPSTEQLRKERLDSLLNTPTGRDFTINTAVGVVFKVHSIMLIGGPKALEHVAFPKENVPGENVVNLPDRFHPLLVDRLVSFIYTSSYAVDARAVKNTTLHHHAALPSGATPTSFGLSMDAAEFQVCMYGIAEVLEYTALMTFAYSKLSSYFIFDRKAPEHVGQLIKLVFGPVNSLSRKCKDEVGALKGLGIAAVLVHEKKHWSGHEMDEFRDLLANELGQDAWKEYRACYKHIKDANQVLLVEPKSAPNMHGYATRQATKVQGIGSLTSSMSKIALAGGSKPNILETLHGLFDEYAYWPQKALRKKTGRSTDTLEEALPKVAQQVRGGQFHGCWQRKAHFNRPPLWMCTEAMGQINPNIQRRSESQDLHSQYEEWQQAKFMGIGHVPDAKGIDFFGHAGTNAGDSTFPMSNPTLESIPLAKRKFAKPSRNVLATPPRIKIVDNDGEDDAMDHDAADATSMMASKHAPKAPKLTGMANATFTFASDSNRIDFSSTPDKPQPGTISLEGLKKLQEVGVANKVAKKTVKAAEKEEAVKKAGMDTDENKENIPLESKYEAPKVEEEEERDEEMVD
ncbi:uncharacterized protein N0V89_012331 [Didymosphaeria variabile]|uniref:TFIIF beta subunit HTH domain-containing protein n=1 Tax=Didymosphaeria variabile TaxID=1932322 RepID=A0A9W8XAA5_9PLEO|nr:uncharacterized protein N0V89_012331 [Didymosphaeria variabile]KAJ4344587.1 hypothetical protein N0V89_012331 [Didymosphaeria variabile]